MRKYGIVLLLVNILCVGGLVYNHAAKESVQTGSSRDEVCEERPDESPRIALTFDDGPNRQWTAKLLDGLKERGVQASFFVIGEKAASQPELIRRMYREGHVIGNHTFSHVQLTALTEEEACREIAKTNETLYGITGEYPHYIRPPFGSWNENLECRVELLPVMWTIDTLDWTTKNKDRVVKKAVSNARDNGIILLHDNYESSVEAALEIIDCLRKQGYEFVTVEELLLE